MRDVQLQSCFTSALDGAECSATCSARCISKARTLLTGKYRVLLSPYPDQEGNKLNISVRMAWISFGVLTCKGIKLDDSSRLDVVEIARVY